jgi:type II secretory pathway predicted ATPase ExeA
VGQARILLLSCPPVFHHSNSIHEMVASLDAPGPHHASLYGRLRTVDQRGFSARRLSIQPMFLNFYGLSEQPFGVTPDPRFLYHSAAHREALASLLYGVQSMRGFLALIAPPGTGKTTLLFELSQRLNAKARIAFLFQTQCSSEQFMRLLLTEIGCVEADMDSVRSQQKFNEMLLAEARAEKPVLLIVDEAQNLDSNVLETIRLLSNFETPANKLLQIILAGQPQLAEKLAAASLSQLRQRISIMTSLRPLSPEEVRGYIEYRMRVAGIRGALPFTAAALDFIAELSEGVPRLVNNYCHSALALGFALKQRCIDVDVITEVANDFDFDKLICNQRPADAGAGNAKPPENVTLAGAPLRATQPYINPDSEMVLGTNPGTPKLSAVSTAASGNPSQLAKPQVLGAFESEVNANQSDNLDASNPQSGMEPPAGLSSEGKGADASRTAEVTSIEGNEENLDRSLPSLVEALETMQRIAMALEAQRRNTRRSRCRESIVSTVER